MIKLTTSQRVALMQSAVKVCERPQPRYENDPLNVYQAMLSAIDPDTDNLVQIQDKKKKHHVI